MALRFFSDQCVPQSIVEMLKNSGHHVEILRDHVPISSTDDVVIKKAQELNAILLTLNGDFSDIITYPPALYRGIIAIQLRNHPEIIPDIINRLNDFFRLNPDMDYYQGKLILAEVHRIRLKQ